MFETLIIIAMGILFLIVLPIMATYKYWNYKPVMKYALSLIWISYIVIAYEIINPRDSFYINHLKNVSGSAFDDKMKMTYKHTSFLDSKGEYFACAVFEISPKDVKLLNSTKIELEPSPFNTKELASPCKEEITKVFNNKDLLVYKKFEEKESRAWGYIPNSNKVFMTYNFRGMPND